MRRFRFVGNASDYNGPIKNGVTYDEDYIPWTEDGKPDDDWDASENVLEAFLNYPEDWKEVTDSEEPAKPLHKDTDLGYFSGLAMKSIIDKFILDDIDNDVVSKWSISIAKELIKQLNEETK